MTIEQQSGMTRIPIDTSPERAMRRTQQRRTEFVEGATSHLSQHASRETREGIAQLAGELFDSRIQVYLATIASRETVNIEQ